jgi:hypothetical protein
VSNVLSHLMRSFSAVNDTPPELQFTGTGHA